MTFLFAPPPGATSAPEAKFSAKLLGHELPFSFSLNGGVLSTARARGGAGTRRTFTNLFKYRRRRRKPNPQRPLIMAMCFCRQWSSFKQCTAVSLSKSGGRVPL